MNKESLIEDDSFVLTNARGAFSQILAEFTLAAVLYFNKNIPRLVSSKENRKWDRFTMPTLQGKQFAFIGFGDIAQTSAELLQKNFDIRIKVLKRTKCSVDEFEGLRVDEVVGIEDPKEEVDEIFRNADFVHCSLPGVPEMENFVDEKKFRLMKDTCVFISNGRGLCVDEDALAKALHKGEIAGAALDVFKQEPLPAESPLWDCPNLLLSPHNSNWTDDILLVAYNHFKRNLKAYLEKKPLISPVDKKLGY